MAFEKTQEKLDELRNLTWQNGKLIESLSQLSVNGLETELQQGKNNIVSAIKSKGVDASQDSSLTQLAEDIKNIEATNLDLNSFTFNEDVKVNSLIDFLAYRNSITEIDSDAEIELNDDYALSNLNEVESISLHNCRKIDGKFVFYDNPKLKKVHLPEAQGNLFPCVSSKTNLEEFIAPKITSLRLYDGTRNPFLENLTNLKKVNLDSLEVTERPLLHNDCKIEVFRCPNLIATEISSFSSTNMALVKSATVKKVEFPMLSIMYRYDKYNEVAVGSNLLRVQVGALQGINVNGINLIDLECGEVNTNLSIMNWKPLNVLADPEKITTLNYNIREHIAKKIADRSNQSPLTITFKFGAEAVRNVLTEETEAVFASKNWNISPAKSV